MDRTDVIIIGAGLAGSVAALALARRGRKVALVTGQPASVLSQSDDQRTTALMDQSIRFLDRLGLWPALEKEAEALSTLQIVDGTQRLLRAPPVAFRSGEIGLPAFGYNFRNRALLAQFDKAIRAEANIILHEQPATAITVDDTEVLVTLAEGQQIGASLLVGADGRESVTRKAAGIATRRWSYPQTAIVLNFAHALPHDNVSTEFHTESGPFTQVPLKGNRSSLVWVVEPAEAERIQTLSLEDLSREVESRMQSMLGTVTVEGELQAWPLSGMTATRCGKGRVALVGEAAHAFPPIGAQGLNLSLRDVMALEDLVGDRPDEALPADLGNRFDRRRKPDVLTRTASVDLLNRSLLSSLLPVQMARSTGLHLLARVSPLRHFAMREGVEPGRGLGALTAMVKDRIRARF